MSEPLWVPSPERVGRTALAAFMQAARARTGRPLPDYDALHAWSIDDPSAFWSLLWQHVGVIAHAPPKAVLEHPTMPGATWFRGARLNFAENLLRHRGPRAALIAIDERGGPPEVLSFDALAQQVAHLQAWLLSVGVQPGDRVAAWMPNRVETVVTMLAAASLGAVFSSSSPDFGPRGVLDRFGQIGPTVLLVADGSHYAGKAHPLLPRVAEVAEALGESLRAVVVVPVLSQTPDLTGIPRALTWQQATADGPDEPSFTPLPFDHPLYIMYSSGTTGVPKCIVHGAGGTLLQHAKEHVLHTDLSTDDVLMYFTTAGWMMWNWLVSALFSGTTVVLWDGSAVHPTADVLWQVAEDHGVTVFGTSPKFLSLCSKEGLEPGRQHDLSRLKAILSTGSPLSIENFRWVYEHVSQDVQLASICGGTDILSCFMLGSPISPVYPGEIQKRGLGMAVEAWTAQGTSVVGEKAELVCTRPFPSMPLGFWNDPDGSRYHRAYFDAFPGIWRHGDYIEITEHGGVVVYGRSDATLNPGGVRIGTAEIYRPVEAMDDIVDSVVVGLPLPDQDVEVVLFVVLRPGVAPSPALLASIRARIRTLASPRHVPSRIFMAPAVPRTISGKKVEIAIASVLQGQTASNRDALANPEALDWFATEGRRLVEAGG